MGHYTQSLLFLLGWNLLCCDATVSVSLINSANGVYTLECGSDDGIVSCRINPYAGLINWEINGIPFATCAPGCSENPNITRNYSPTYDVVNGVFNLTVDGATFDDDSTIFKCDDGVSFDSITIEVVPAYSENKTNINTTDEGKHVEFTTACVQPGVEFEWFTVKTNNSDRKTYNNEPTEMTENTTECSLNLACGGVGTDKVSSKIMIPTVSNGEERYLEVVVKYKNPDEERTFRFDEIFHFKDESMVNDDSGFPIWIVILIVIGFFVVIAISIAVLFACTRKNQGKCKCTRSMNKSESYCLDCGQYLCERCIKNHAKHNIFRHCQQEADETRYKIFCKLCETKSFRKQDAKYYNNVDKSFVCEECKPKGGMEEDIIDVDDFYFHSENNVMSYCLLCQQYLCKLCFAKHDDHEMILRHSHQEAAERKHQIFCYRCKKNDAKFYSDGHKHFVCKDCKSKDGLGDFISIDDFYFHSKNNVESYCLSCQSYLCKFCFKKHATHKILWHNKREAAEKQHQILCNQCKKNDAKYYSDGRKHFVCKECKSKEVLRDFISIDEAAKRQCQILCNQCKQNDAKYYSDGRKHFVCEECKSKEVLCDFISIDEAARRQCQILCNQCKQNDAKYYSDGRKHFVCEDCKSKEVLRDFISIDEAAKKQCQIFCNRCKTNDAKYYSDGRKHFVCEECTAEEGLHDIISIDEATERQCQIFCNRCKTNDAKYYSDGRKHFVCEECTSEEGLHDIISIDDFYFHSKKNVESYCLSCQSYLCKLCFTKHATPKILRHYQQDKKTQCQILCSQCNRSDAKYYSSCHKSFVCEACKSEEGQKDINSMNDLYFHNENNVESYCLSCQSYLCKLCLTKHATHKILRHYQQETGKILCERCPRMNTTKDAKYYSKCDNIFVCEECKPERGLEDIIDIDEIGLEKLYQEVEYKEGCKENQVKIYCMINEENTCEKCFKKERNQPFMSHASVETSKHVKYCALHLVADLLAKQNAPLTQNDADESHADVLCLGCKMCFKQHLGLKQLWLPDEEKLEKQTRRITILYLRPVRKETNHEV